ncbi:glycosyltransferase family 2 protein [Paenibacillus hexagrammi]|uniref:Glycosyltransferase n=1 Tax=Paenibacillus hexagrammi TaxID=2908839 RepID=A0ABY3SF47_9BACL|nr:hypothetical protein [Paenibacillus sp. YPD9-1]UJF31542.1 hypothetical protein L0M14_17195 [Paenibacillus sp. YPD9-1]
MLKSLLTKAGLWKESFLHVSKVTPIITQEDIRNNFNIVNSLLWSWDEFFPQGIENNEFNRLDVAPWVMFISRCASVEKAYLLKVGLFDEKLIYGGEDQELGYRLYKYGLSFAHIDRSIGYHQDHPAVKKQVADGGKTFFTRLYEKYGVEDPELTLMSVLDPIRDIRIYHNTLRILQNNGHTQEQADLITALKSACKTSAERYLKH